MRALGDGSRAALRVLDATLNLRKWGRPAREIDPARPLPRENFPNHFPRLQNFKLSCQLRCVKILA